MTTSETGPTHRYVPPRDGDTQIGMTGPYEDGRVHLVREVFSRAGSGSEAKQWNPVTCQWDPAGGTWLRMDVIGTFRNASQAANYLVGIGEVAPDDDGPGTFEVQWLGADDYGTPDAFGGTDNNEVVEADSPVEAAQLAFDDWRSDRPESHGPGTLIGVRRQRRIEGDVLGFKVGEDNKVLTDPVPVDVF